MLASAERRRRAAPSAGAGEARPARRGRATSRSSAGGEHDQRERDLEEEDRDEAQRGDRRIAGFFERAPADAHHGLDDDRDHRRLETVEERLDDARSW